VSFFIVPSELLDHLNDAEATAAAQRGKYELTEELKVIHTTGYLNTVRVPAYKRRAWLFTQAYAPAPVACGK
jgi:hypothetical protein